MTDGPGHEPPTTTIEDEAGAVATVAPEPAAGDAVTSADEPALARARAICPYLAGRPGDWRSINPDRDHTCGAVEPPALVASEKQRRLCLVAAHTSCATYLAARGIDDDDESTTDGGARPVEAPAWPVDGSARPSGAERGRWAVPRTAPVVLERGGPSLAGLRIDRTTAQVGLIALMILAFAVLAVARLTAGPGEAGAGSGVSPSPSVGASASPAPSPVPSPSPSPAPSLSPSPLPSPTPSAGPSPSPVPSSSRTYRVRSGDTLIGIASRFGTTVAAIRSVNGLTSTVIHPGQVLKIP